MPDLWQKARSKFSRDPAILLFLDDLMITHAWVARHEPEYTD